MRRRACRGFKGDYSVRKKRCAAYAGSFVPLTMLRAFTSLIVDVHGQHEHQSLLSDENAFALR
jgi:DNA repair ATPase RecN